jgi:hypothetical protein
MTRKFSPQKLKELTRISKEHRQWAKESFEVCQSKLQTLENDRKKYAPDYFRQLQQQVKETALSNLRLYAEQLRDELAPALAERELHSRESYLLDARVTDEVLEKDRSKEGRTLKELSALNHTMRELLLSARIARLDDDRLVARAEIAARTGDLQMAAVVLDEVQSRPGGLAKIGVERALKDIATPEAEAASEFFTEAERTLNEIEARWELVKNPADQGAYATIRSREISEAREAREAEERKAKEEAAAEQKVKDLEKRKQQAREYIAKGAPIPTPEKVPSIAAQMAKKEAELQANWKTYQQPGNGKTEGTDEPPTDPPLAA